MVPALTGLNSRSAKEVQSGETLLVENGQIAQLAEDLDRRRMERGEVKRPLVQEQMFRLQEEERQVVYRQDLV